MFSKSIIAKLYSFVNLFSQAEEIVWCQAQSDWVVEFDSIGHGRHGLG